MLADYECLATGRERSAFAEDLEDNRALLYEGIRGSRLAVIGAAGSIGFSVVRSILEFQPAGIALIDLSENNLVEVVRELRSADEISVPEDFRTLPIGLGSIECTRFFQETAPFDYILNLSAMKHVRSEKDVFCLARMIDTNVLFPHELLEDIPYDLRKFFSVSSDKAANPANLMGASKMIMEEMLLCQRRTFSTARFANVAFSDGSLPYGLVQRIQKRQAVSAPKDVKRYFMSHQEAGQICLLSCMLGENGDVFFPKLQQRLNERTFSEIAVGLLSHLGYDAVECASESEAKGRANELIPQGKWPCYFFETDTTGEKSFEEFYSADEEVDVAKYRNIGVIKRSADGDRTARLEAFIDFSRKAKLDRHVTKSDYVREMQKIVPGLNHIEKSKNLDQKM